LGQGILNRPLLDIAGVMWNHSPGMGRVFQEQRATRPKFEPSEMASLLAFLYYLGSLDPPGDVAVGARLFVEKRCKSCHSLGGKGGSVGPKLDKFNRYASPVFLTAALWKHGKHMAKKMREKKVLRPTFQGNDIPDLLAYIQSVGRGVERVYIPPGNPQHGKKLFTQKRCAECHKITGHGKGVGPDLRVKLKGSLMQIAGEMWNHGPKMWTKMRERGINVPSLSPEEMSDLISYLYFLQFIDHQGNIERGEAVYREKRCGACHSFPRAGEKRAPDLTKVEKLETPLEVITEMWNHSGGMERMMLEQNVAWPVFKGGEMADLIAYLLAVRGGGSRTLGPGNSERRISAAARRYPANKKGAP
ncbi:MAG: c-type cytochrome, partial [Candidatus Binatia bacterium]